MTPLRPAVILTLLAGTALAQANAVPGTDVNLYDVGGTTIYGRRGPAYPNGEVGIGFGHGFCNGGTVHVPWQTSPTTSGQMTDVHFKIAFLVARDNNGRMEQISKRNSFVKHSRVTYNLGSSQCGTCQSGPSSTFRIGCFDAYSTGFNGDRFNLGPSHEINPWLGSWNPVGSYFDAGDPAVSGTAAMDGTQSLTFSQISAFDSVKNRVTIAESELAQGGTFYGQVHLVCEGEPGANRGNNQRSARLNINWNGGSWSISNGGNQLQGTVLEQWSGANVAEGGNGNDDGRFAVAVKVTGPTNGMYHYEYAVHNIDNHRGGASFRIPLTAAVNVQNPDFRDIDDDPLNEWTFSQSPTELAFQATATNPLDWNTIYNFSFDCDTPPGVGGIIIDQARLGPGALTVSVISEAPGGVQPAAITSIGNSCGHCDTSVYENFTSPSSFDLANSAATFTLNSGSYDVGSGTGTFSSQLGNNLNLGDDTQTIVNLPFQLPYPGGTTNFLRVCSNGFISPAGDNSVLWIPLPQLLLNQHPRWAVAWHDYAPNLGGGVFARINASGATITWNNVANSGAGGSSTFQAQFLPNGTVHMIWQNMSSNGNAYVVGWSPGAGALDPGNTDLSAALPGGISLCANAPQQISLSASARPILGTTIQQTISGIAPGTPFVILTMSFDQANPPVDLTSFGMEGCFSHTMNNVNEFFDPAGASSFAIPFTIPNDPALSTIEIFSQGYSYNPPLTSLGLIASNAISLFLGPL